MNPSNKLYFFVTVDGVSTRHNVWSHAQDARTYLPVAEPPAGLVHAFPRNVDTEIQIVWPHGNLPVEKAKLVNVTAVVYKAGTRLAVGSDVDDLPTLRLHWGLNNNADSSPDGGMTGTPRVVVRNGLSFWAWDFNDVDVSEANNPLNKYFFWVTADGHETYPNVWAHGADARTIFPQPDVPVRSCR